MTPNNHEYDHDVTETPGESSTRLASSREERVEDVSTTPTILSGPTADHAADDTNRASAAAAARESDEDADEDENAEDAAEQGVIASLHPRTVRERRLVKQQAK